MSIKSKIAIFSALLVLLSSGSLPALAAAVSPAAVSWRATTGVPAVSESVSTSNATSNSQLAIAFVQFTSPLAVGDVWAVSASVVRPTGSQVSMTDSNGSATGTAPLFSGQSSINWPTPTFSAGSGLITSSVNSAFTPASPAAFVKLGLFSFTPDVAGDYEIILKAMTDSGSGWQPLESTTQKFSATAYGVISATATVVQAAENAYGVELDADGNVYWLDGTGLKIFRTDALGVTTQFSAARLNSSKLFIDGAWLFVKYNDLVYRIALNNTDPTALPSLIQGVDDMFPMAVDQAVAYTRIRGQSYVGLGKTKEGQIWRYPVATEPVAVSSYSVAANEATLVVPSGHDFVVGDVIRTQKVGDTNLNELSVAPPSQNRTITASTTTTIKFAFTSSNVDSTATPRGQVAKTIGASTLLATVTGVRGMSSSLDGRYLFLASETQGAVLRLDTQAPGAGALMFTDLRAAPFRYAPADVNVLYDGSLVVSSFSPDGALWHISAEGKILNKIEMKFANGVNVAKGYDLRVSPDGSKIYLAAQNQGFLSLALSRPISGSTRGTSNPIAPISGPIPLTAAAGSVLSTGAMLRGSVNPNGAAAKTQFRWSTDPTFPASSTFTSPVQNLLSGSTAVPLEHQATELTTNTTYYSQIMAGGAAANEVFGAVRSFKTSAPGITAVSPNTGVAVGGTAVQLTIQGFSSAPTVKVGGVLATNVVFTAPSTLTFDTPPQAGTGILIESGSLSVSATFTYASPLITAISPVSGVEAGGFAVTVSGSNFTGATGCTVDGIATTFSFVSDGSLTFTAPANSSGSKTVQVTTPSGTAAIQLAYEPALPNPAPTQSAPSAPSTPSNPAPEAPTIRAPRAVISVTLSKGVVDRKSRIVLTLPEASQDSPINSVRVQLKNSQGEITQTLVIPLNEKTDTLDFEVPLAYGDYDVSVSTFNAAGYSSELVNVAGLVAKDTISGISSTKWPTVKGVKMLQRLLFEPNSSRLTAAAKRSLLAIRENLKGFSGRVLVSGFAAKFGPASRGKQISTARALAVAKELKALGLNSWIEYHGHGQLPSSARGMRRVDVSLMEYSMLKK